MSVQTRRAKEIRGYIEKWLPRLWLHQWHVNVTISGSNDKASPTLFAYIEYRPRYFEADLIVYPYLWEAHADDAAYREATIVHELCHIIVGQLDILHSRLREGHPVNADQWKDALEQATEAIAKALVR